MNEDSVSANGQDDKLAEQLNRYWQRVSLLASAHSELRDRYHRRSAWLRYPTLGISTVLISLVLVSAEFVERTTGITEDAFRSLTAAAALLNFLMVLIDLAWQPTRRAGAHQQAARYLTQVKYEIEKLQSEAGYAASDVERIRRMLDDESIPHIPNRKFLWLKKLYHLKVMAARRLEDDPDYPVSCLWLRSWCRGVRKRWRHSEPMPKARRKQEASAGVPLVLSEEDTAGDESRPTSPRR